MKLVVLNSLSLSLNLSEFELITAPSFEAILDLAIRHNPEAILVSAESVEAVRGLAQQFRDSCSLVTVPILAVGQKDVAAMERQHYFEAGVADYIGLSSPEELAYRIKMVVSFSQWSGQKTACYVHQSTDEDRQLIRTVYELLQSRIRNPLTTLTIGAQMLTQVDELKPEDEMILKEIQNGISRIKHILDSISQVNDIVIGEYLAGTPMVNLPLSGLYEKTRTL